VADFDPTDGPASACDLCGERPGRIRVHLHNGNEQTYATLCERCTRQAMQAGGLPLVGALANGAAAAPPDAGQGGGSSTPSLDEFGRDLTAEAAEGRIDPVIGRDAEIEQTVEILSRRLKKTPY